MRLLHTSDWHLGQYFHGHDRAVEHQVFLDWLLDVLVDQAIEVLLIAGDIYDQAHPAAETQRQFYAFLRAARTRMPELQIVAIGGNHDSPARLEAPLPLLQALNITMVGKFDPEHPESVLVPLHDRSGKVAAWCLAVPYLRPADLPRALADGDWNYPDAVAAVYARLTNLALARREQGQAVLALGHLHLQGGKSSLDSERKLVIGGNEAVASQVFDPQLAYVALGHLHLAQWVGQEHLRYCGSPLPLSFTEIDYQHQVLRIELSGEQCTGIEPMFIPRAVPMLRLPATPQPLAEALSQLRALQVAPVAAGLEPFIDVQVRLDQPEPGLRPQVEQALAGKAVRLARISTSGRHTGPGSKPVPLGLDDLQQLSPHLLLASAWSARYEGPLPAALASALDELLGAP